MREEGLIDELSFGGAALERYLEEPDEGYYIKSPEILPRRLWPQGTPDRPVRGTSSAP